MFVISVIKNIQQRNNMKSDILEVCKKIQSGNTIIRNHWAVNRRNKQEWALLVRNQMKL